jgi:hypoxanthine phosphoribosyltransferase
VLVVDDSCDDRETLRELFMWIESETKLPIVFEVAKNGKEAFIFIMLGLVLI